ncbi:hypothetical protein J4Q44_G00183210 [Coregonus suidteri]|uniref:Uncharacterized protein n=1 Tax=Coregonus suidteri TaxID=861788 RepID=A0AAN8QTC9_9TELE
MVEGVRVVEEAATTVENQAILMQAALKLPSSRGEEAEADQEVEEPQGGPLRGRPSGRTRTVVSPCSTAMAAANQPMARATPTGGPSAVMGSTRGPLSQRPAWGLADGVACPDDPVQIQERRENIDGRRGK